MIVMDTSGSGSSGPLGCSFGTSLPIHRQPRAVYKYWAPRRWLTSCVVRGSCSASTSSPRCISSSTDWWFQLFLRQVPTVLSVRPWRLHWCCSCTENSGVAAGAAPAVLGGVLASRTVEVPRLSLIMKWRHLGIF